MRNFIKINLFLNKLKKKQNESFSFASFAMLNRKRRYINGENEECTTITAHVLVLNTLFVLSVFRENRWTKSALLFGCWLIVFIWTAVVDLFWGEKGWLIHLQRWYYCAILLQIAGTLIVYFSFFV